MNQNEEKKNGLNENSDDKLNNETNVEKELNTDNTDIEKGESVTENKELNDKTENKETEISEDKQNAVLNKPQKKKFGLPSILILVVCAVVLVISGSYIVKELIDNNQTASDIDELHKIAYTDNDKNKDIAEDNEDKENSSDSSKNNNNSTGVDFGDNQLTYDQSSNEEISLEEVDLDKIGYLNVSLDKFKQLNSDTVGWLSFPGPSSIKGLPISLPIVITTDNEYYLNNNFNKEPNINGWVFADYEADFDNLTSYTNTVIYGHARSYNMFGGLKDLDLNPKWQDNANNHFIKINTETEETIWQIFSWYETNIYYNYIKTEFKSDEEFVAFLNDLQEHDTLGCFAEFDFQPSDRIITLSTCKGLDKDVRVALHAKLVKSRTK